MGRSTAILLLAAWFAASGCAPVGSEAWCKKMKKKAKGDWTANEAADFARHCVLR